MGHACCFRHRGKRAAIAQGGEKDPEHGGNARIQPDLTKVNVTSSVSLRTVYTWLERFSLGQDDL